MARPWLKKVRHCILGTLAFGMAHAALAQSEINSYAFVQPDSSLKISGYQIYLYGVYIPPTDQTCNTRVRPISCGTRASLALEFAIGADFVRCITRARRSDGSLIASCSANGQDLSEYMLQRGWAVALPDAPFEYAAMEKIARSRGFGVWGTPVDAIQRR